ncbi:hypothetical protein GCM10027615_73080 [Plantactinospora veratri]
MGGRRPAGGRFEGEFIDDVDLIETIRYVADVGKGLSDPARPAGPSCRCGTPAFPATVPPTQEDQ